MECIGLSVHWQLESEYSRIELSTRGIKNSFNDFHPNGCNHWQQRHFDAALFQVNLIRILKVK